jgi:hypothetical protein
MGRYPSLYSNHVPFDAFDVCDWERGCSGASPDVVMVQNGLFWERITILSCLSTRYEEPYLAKAAA